MNKFIFPLPRQCFQKQRQENHHLLMPFLANSVQWEHFSRKMIRFHPIQNLRLTPLPINPLPKEDFVLLVPSNMIAQCVISTYAGEDNPLIPFKVNYETAFQQLFRCQFVLLKPVLGSVEPLILSRRSMPLASYL